ncbi:MAG: DUF6382 domain-containing protein [Clostridiales Family XIII bacterium]|nr:DUF6382 domain-containing protein [Clostridiales Family XIII bacterium]
MDNKHIMLNNIKISTKIQKSVGVNADADSYEIAESGGGKKWLRASAEKTPLPHEKKILALGACPGILPAVTVREGTREVLQYDLTGHRPLSICAFSHVDDMLGVYDGMLRIIMEAEDRLLVAKRFSMRSELIFIHGRTGAVSLTYGICGRETEGFTDDFHMLLEDEKTRRETLGASAAIAQIQEAIQKENPDIRGLLRIVEEVRRQWNCIHPPSR